jgi:D-hydroxyproline dehydrogenase subunit alpha
LTRRLDNKNIRRVGATRRIRFDGREIEALAGESVAAALAAAGIRTLRQTRTGVPRGLWCGMGACFECVVTIDGKPEQRACLAKVEDGMDIRSTAPDTPAALAPVPTAEPERRQVDVLVIGGGPAGLHAARVAAEAGLNVVLLDERPAPGGQYFKPLGASHAFAANGADKQFLAGAALVAATLAAGATILNDSIVWAAFSPDEIGALIDGRSVLFAAKNIVVAAGAYERPVPMPGWTLPGVSTTGAVQTLSRSYRVAPGARTIVAGNGPLNLQTALELVEGGANVVAVVESAPRPGLSCLRDAWRLAMAAPDLAVDGIAMLRKLAAAKVQILWGRTAVAAEADANGEFAALVLDDGTRLAGEALALGYGFAPSSEIARQLGVAHRFVDRHVGYLAAVTADDGSCNVPHVYVVGDGAEIGGSRIAAARGILAGSAIAGRTAPPETTRDLAQARRFQEALWRLYTQAPFDAAALADSTTVCRCEDVSAGTVRACLDAGAASLGAIKRHTRAGMGRCQGRNCAATLARLVQSRTGALPGEYDFFAPRVPAKPVPVAALAVEQGEWGGHKQVEAPLPIAARTRLSHAQAKHNRSCDALVIGGGVLGASCALGLAKAGVDVIVAERDEPNLQASGANAGSLHVQLLSFDFGAKAQAGGGPAAQTLVLGPAAIALWRDIERAWGQDLEIRTTGGLMVAETDKDMAFLAAKVALEKSYGIECDVIGANELRALAPALSERLVGAAYCPSEGKINPAIATYAVVGLAERHGARFENGTHVEAIERVPGGFRVVTSNGTIDSKRIVNAAGPWSARIGAMLGINVPVKGAPLQIVVTTPGPKIVTQLIAHADRHLTLKQADTGGFIVGGGWTAASDPATGLPRVLRGSMEGNLWVARRVIPALDGCNVLRGWAAMNVNLDGAPLVGEVPGVPGFFNAVTSNGYTLGPIVGQITADLMCGRDPGFDVTPFLIQRFGAGAAPAN